jgi:hypothetical protein
MLDFLSVLFSRLKPYIEKRAAGEVEVDDKQI